MAKKETHIPAIIDTPEALEAKIAAMKEAQKIFATYTQEQTKPVFRLQKQPLKKQEWVS